MNYLHEVMPRFYLDAKSILMQSGQNYPLN